MKKVKYFQAIDCPECGCCMSLDRDAHSIKCTWRDCKSRGIVFHAPTMEFELVPIERPRRHANKPVYYGLWSAEHTLWMTRGHDNLVIHSASLPLIKATCQAANKLAIVTDWQVKIIGGDGLPVDLPED